MLTPIRTDSVRSSRGAFSFRTPFDVGNDAGAVVNDPLGAVTFIDILPFLDINLVSC